MKKDLIYRIQAFALLFFFRLLGLLPIGLASTFGGIMGCAIGPFFSAHRTARKNLRMVFPDMSERDLRRLTDRMWEHFGRVGAEYAFLASGRLAGRVVVEGVEHLPAPGQAALIFTGHIGNWELLPPIMFEQGVAPTIVYRHTNNPYVDGIIADARRPHVSELIQKGLRGGIKILGALKRGQAVAMLIDQKQNNGIAVPLFGRDAMTSPAIAEIALKYNIPIIPARIIRTDGCNFKATVYPAVQFTKTENHKDDVKRLMLELHGILEGWIHAHPEQWFWVHRRWPKETT